MNNGLLIQGKNVHVFKYIEASPFEFVCGTDVVFELTQELIGATTPDSGKFKEVRPRLREFTVTISGVSTSENDSNISVFYMLGDTVVDAVQDIEIVYTDNNGNDVSIRGNFFIETLNISGPADAQSGYEIRLRSWGDYSSTALVDPELAGSNVTSDSYTVTAGVIQDNRWIGLTSANIKLVCREGTEQLSMGLPYSFNGTTGTITPDAATSFDGQRMYVLWTF
jgi:predicted secreted protein